MHMLYVVIEAWIEPLGKGWGAGSINGLWCAKEAGYARGSGVVGCAVF